MEIVSPWARATAASVSIVGVLPGIVSKCSTDERLLSIYTPAAGMAEVHRTEPVFRWISGAHYLGVSATRRR